jgi:hypothetical protein
MFNIYFGKRRATLVTPFLFAFAKEKPGNA